jgi:endonuclease/exonuclease/phosphatase (EEP) superfamily protein YafD
MDIVNELASALHFRPVALRNDARKTFNGLPLDHVFVRGLAVRESTTRAVRSSDHNPIIIEFSL